MKYQSVVYQNVRPQTKKPASRSQLSPVVNVRKTTERTEKIAAKEVSKEIYKINGSWPFDFYPDELIIEEKRIIINQRYFPFGRTEDTIAISELSLFELMDSMFFSSIHIKAGKTVPSLDLTMKWFPQKQAQRAKDIVEGLRLKENESIELNSRNNWEMRQSLGILGSSSL